MDKLRLLSGDKGEAQPERQPSSDASREPLPMMIMEYDRER